MKKGIFAVGIISLTLVIGFMMAGCGGSSALAGRWVSDDGNKISLTILELSKDGKGEMNGNAEVSWAVENGRLILTTLGLGNVYSYGYKIADKKLTLTDDRGSSSTFVKKE